MLDWRCKSAPEKQLVLVEKEVQKTKPKNETEIATQVSACHLPTLKLIKQKMFKNIQVDAPIIFILPKSLNWQRYALSCQCCASKVQLTFQSDSKKMAQSTKFKDWGYSTLFSP